MKNKRFLLILSQLFLYFALFAQQYNAEITTNELKSTIGYLASDSLKEESRELKKLQLQPIISNLNLSKLD